jgi:hypothetical protein
MVRRHKFDPQLAHLFGGLPWMGGDSFRSMYAFYLCSNLIEKLHLFISRKNVVIKIPKVIHSHFPDLMPILWAYLICVIPALLLLILGVLSVSYFYANKIL